MSQPAYYNNNADFIGASMANADALDSLWLPRHQRSAMLYGVAIASLIGLVTVLHWTSFLLSKDGIGRRISNPLLILARRLNSVSIGEHSPPMGYVIIVLLYLGINLAIALHDRPYDSGVLVTFAQRMGWMTLCNLCVTIFLSLKNTPLFPLTGRSFDEINVLHRCAGYTTIGCMIIHSISYLDGLIQINLFAYTMAFPRNHFGGVAGLSLLVILCTATGMIRRRYYEIFYVVHVVFVAVILIAVGFHRDEVAQGELVITLLAASFWFADKTVRCARWVFFGVKCHCTIEALPHEATKVTMDRSIWAMPGSMTRLYIPSVHAGQRHPFSLVSNDPATFVVKARHGFTKSLYEKALAAGPKSHLRLRASFEGPYGGFPSLAGYNKVILIAGGSGITFSTSIAVAWSKTTTEGDLSLNWSVRDQTCLSWLDDQWPTLTADPRAKINLYVSKPAGKEQTAALGKPNGVDADSNTEKSEGDSSRPNDALNRAVAILNGRPDVNRILAESLEVVGRKDNVLVAACGPKPLAMAVRKAVANCKSSAASNIKMHIEEFSF